MNIYRKCATCGKRFIPADLSLYTYRTVHKGTVKWFCGWNCMRDFERKHEKKMKGTGLIVRGAEK